MFYNQKQYLFCLYRQKGKKKDILTRYVEY